MIEKYINPKATVLNMSSDPFVANLVIFPAKIALAEKLQEWLKEDTITLSSGLGVLGHRFMSVRRFEDVMVEDNHCHIPPNRFEPYAVGVSITFDATIDLIKWMVEHYGLPPVDPRAMKSCYADYFVLEIRDIINQYGKNRRHYTDPAMVNVSADVLERLVRFVDEHKPVKVPEPKPKLTWFQLFLKWIKIS